MHIKSDHLQSDKDYQARGIVARINKIGEYQENVFTKRKIYKVLTLDCGKGRSGIAVKYVRQAKKIEVDSESFLDFSDLKEGEIVVTPGLIYKKIPMSSRIMECHLNALKTYRPKTIIKAYKGDDEAIEGGVIDLREEK